ncbi:FAD-dependent oxidoreductase [Desulfovibrio sp. OttesenSCG-928-F07]|nr:FAD-dependent oxidoreductase [Desulfovibrio sp. OttesenSCG-928-F07]
MKYDLIVIGAGAAGTEAAFTGAAHNLKTMLVEPAFAGGTCLNVGCIPTKFLLGSTAVLTHFSTQKKFKAVQGDISVDFNAIQERKNRYIKGMRTGLEKRLTDAGITYVNGKAAFISGTALHITQNDGEAFDAEFEKCIVATGSTPASFPGIEPDGKNVLTSTGLLNLTEAPESLLIIGGGVIGIELGEFYSRLGTKITVIEAMDRIVLSEDPEVSEAVHKQFTREGWNIHVNRRVKSVSSENNEAVLVFEDGETLRGSKALVAVGRRPGTQWLNIDKASLTTKRGGFIETGPTLLAAPNIYAVGDINGRVLLAHAAEHQARYAARHAAGLENNDYNDEAMPSCIYGHYEMMHVGPHAAALAEEFKSAGKTVSVSRSQLIANPIAQSYGVTQGFVKIVWVDNKVYSISAWGHGVSHLTGLATAIVKAHWSEPEIIFAHPTLDESVKSALLAPKQII